MQGMLWPAPKSPPTARPDPHPATLARGRGRQYPHPQHYPRVLPSTRIRSRRKRTGVGGEMRCCEEHVDDVALPWRGSQRDECDTRYNAVLSLLSVAAPSRPSVVAPSHPSAAVPSRSRPSVTVTSLGHCHVPRLLLRHGHVPPSRSHPSAAAPSHPSAHLVEARPVVQAQGRAQLLQLAGVRGARV